MKKISINGSVGKTPNFQSVVVGSENAHLLPTSVNMRHDWEDLRGLSWIFLPD
jgi:hypothetical protein